MADNITWLLNADASQVRAEMNAAMVAANTGTNQIVQGFNKADLAHGRLLKSNHAVTQQMGHVARSMFYGADAATVASTAFEGLSKVMRLPLLPLAGLIVGAAAIKSIIDYREEWKKVNDELDKAAKPRPAGQNTAEDIKKHAEAASTAIAKATEKIENEGWWGKAKRVTGNLFSQMAAADQRQPGRGVLYKAPTAAEVAFTAEDPKAAAEKKILKAREAQAKDAEDLAKLEHEKLIQAEAEKFKASLQLSLADIAKEGVHRKKGTFDSGRLYGGDVAQEAMDEQAAARKAMLRQDYAGAMKHQARAEELKAGIPALKDSEKIATFRSALDSSTRLREIAEKVTFKNM